MAESQVFDVYIERLKGRSVVSLRVARTSADTARRSLQLAPPLTAMENGAVVSLWLGPDRWLLVSEGVPADRIVARCEEALAGTVRSAVDQSAAFAVFRLTGSRMRSVLAAGCGVDLRPHFFAAGAVCRCRLALVAAVLVAVDADAIEVYVDRSHGDYLRKWLNDSGRTLALI